MFTSDSYNFFNEARHSHISVNPVLSLSIRLNGPNTGTDWAIEGRRTIPLLPRLNACTVFTSLANSLSLATSVANAKKASTSREEVANVKGQSLNLQFENGIADLPSSYCFSPESRFNFHRSYYFSQS